MKTIKELKDIIHRFYVKYALTSEVENILKSCGASEDDSSDEGYFAGMTDSQIRTCYSKIRDLIRYHHENKNPDYFTEDTLIDFDLPDLVLEESFSVYEQMNKIDDNKSLDEKWNVKNQRELKKLKEDVQKLDETSPLVKEIQEYIHDNIFEWNTVGFENDHIYVVFDEDTEEYTIDSCEEELENEFGHACELEFELENENTLLIYVSISDEVDADNYEWFVEHQVDYSLRAKDAQIIERDYGYEFLWISQEDLSEDDAYELAVATNNYLVHLNKVGKLVKGTCYCRSYPEDDYKVQFTVKEDLRFADVEDATVYEYGIIDDSEYFEEEYTTDWNEALETFKNTAHNVQERLLDMDDEEYDDYYSDGVVVRMIKGKEGSDAFDWDTIREVTVFRDSVENEEELEESKNKK